MSFGFSIADIWSVVKLVTHISKRCSDCHTASDELKQFSLKLNAQTTTLLALEQRLPSDPQTPLQGISFLGPALLDCKIMLKQALEALTRYHDSTLNGGSRFKDRHKNWGWQDMKMVREQLDAAREGTERLGTALICHTLKSLISAGERIDYLLTLRADHPCTPIIHSMWDTSTAFVSALDRLNINISINKGFCDNFAKSTLNGDLFLILDTCFATIHKNEDPYRGFFKHRITTCHTTAHPRPVSELKRNCWEPEANSGSRTCPQHPAFPRSKLEHLLHRIRKALPLNISSVVVLLSTLFFAPTVAAVAPGCISTHDPVSWVQALRSTQMDLISVSSSQPSSSSEINPI